MENKYTRRIYCVIDRYIYVLFEKRISQMTN